MSVDPLSTATRNTKRNLLTASVIAIVYRAFDVTITQIPLSGLSIAFDTRVFAFLLVLIVSYFMITFCIYYYIDIRNIEPAQHLKSTFAEWQTAKGAFWNEEATRVIAKIDRSLEDNASYFSASNELRDALQNVFKRLDNPKAPQRPFSANFDYLWKGTSPPNSNYDGDWALVLRAKDQDGVYERADRLLSDGVHSYRRRRTLKGWRTWINYQRARGLYAFRNFVWDGTLPICMGAVAVLALFNLIDVDWLRAIVPAR